MKSIFNRTAMYALAASLLLSPLCASAWTKKIDCEGGTVGSKVSEGSNGFSSAFSKTVYSRDQVGTGAQSCRMGISQGVEGWGEWGGTVTFPSKLTRGQQVWIRLSMYVPSNFNVNTNTGMLKFMRVHTASASRSNEGYHDLLISNGRSQWIDNRDTTASFIYSYEGAPKLHAVGTRGRHDVATGKWESYEMHIKLDSTAKDAGGSGEVRIWKNNELLATITDVPTLSSASSYAQSFFLFTYWNGNAPATQHLYVDDIIMTSDTPANRDSHGNPFIGGTVPKSAPAPMPPSNVTVQ